MELLDRNKSFGRWICVIFRNASTQVDKRMAPLGISRGQYMYLAELFHSDPEPLAQDALAERLFTDKGSTARALSQLEDLGYVRRRRNPDDRRGKTVHLTDKARAANRQFFGILRSISEDLVQGFTDSEKEQVLDLLRRMAANMIRSRAESAGQEISSKA